MNVSFSKPKRVDNIVMDVVSYTEINIFTKRRKVISNRIFLGKLWIYFHNLIFVRHISCFLQFMGHKNQLMKKSTFSHFLECFDFFFNFIFIKKYFYKKYCPTKTATFSNRICFNFIYIRVCEYWITLLNIIHIGLCLDHTILLGERTVKRIY